MTSSLEPIPEANSVWPKSLEELMNILQAKRCTGNLPKEFLFDSVSTDSRRLQAKQIFVALKGDTFDGHDFALQAAKVPDVAALVSQSWFDKLMLDQAILNDARLIIVVDVLESFRLLAASFRSSFAKLGEDRCLIAVGGSNGKTTTKEMLVSMLGGKSDLLLATEKSENGFVGIPKTICQKSFSQKLETIVLEVGIDETDSMKKHVEIVQPDIAALTSLSHEHLEGFGSLEKVVEEELILMNGPWVRVWQCYDPILRRKAQALKRAGDWLVVEQNMQADFDSSLEQSQSLTGASEYGLVIFGTECTDPLAPQVSYSVRLPNETEALFSGSVKLPMPGAHHAANFALALALACARDKQREASSAERQTKPAQIRALENFKNFVPPNMRSNILRFKNSSVMLVDCYNSNPASLRASLEFVKQPYFKAFQKFLFLGDMLDLGTQSQLLHEDIISDLESMPECQLYLFGEAMYSVYIQLQKSRGAKRVQHLPREANPQDWVKDLQFENAPTLVLVKGSRGMAMERLVPDLKEKLSGFG